MPHAPRADQSLPGMRTRTATDKVYLPRNRWRAPTAHLEELARSSKRYSEDEFVTVTASGEVLYVEVRGRHRSSGTPFTLTVAAHDQLRRPGIETAAAGDSGW